MSRFVERRKFQRFLVRDDVFAMPFPRPAGVGQVLNISRGGLCFRYIDSETLSVESGEIRIYTADLLFHLDHLTVKTVYDFAVPEKIPFSSIRMRQRSVRFVDLNSSQVEALEKFFSHFTYGPDEEPALASPPQETFSGIELWL